MLIQSGVSDSQLDTMSVPKAWWSLKNKDWNYIVFTFHFPCVYILTFILLFFYWLRGVGFLTSFRTRCPVIKHHSPRIIGHDLQGLEL